MVSSISGAEEGAISAALPLVDVLTSVPTDGALFTTYTLSLAWFETYLLRSLERAGARRIVLLADPFGVEASLGEALVAGPGVRYTVEPVTAPDGAFHAKVALLWSSNALLVAVGSGNLTYSGMHRNLECWEVLTAGIPSAPERLLSRDVGTRLLHFLEFLRGRVDEESSASIALSDAMRVVDQWLPRLAAPGTGVRWLDTTTEAIGPQIVRDLGTGAGRRLQVLSPFHDPNGAAVLRLAKELDASVELLYLGETTSFPIAGASAQAAGVVARQLEVEDAARPLHAKVFHVVDDDGAHIITGSANATTKALWTTGNTEVSLLRPGRFDDLLPSTPGNPVVQPLDYAPRLNRPLEIVWAFARDESVRVRVRWKEGPPPAELLVGFVDTLEAPVVIPWPSDGRFTVRLPRGFNPLRPRALRIEVIVTSATERIVARAWIAFEELLSATRAYRAALNAWNRMLDRDAEQRDDEDDEILLRAFADEHARTIDSLGRGSLPFRRTADRTSSRDDDESDEVSVPLALIDAIARTTSIEDATASAPGTEGDMIVDVERAMRIAFGLLSEREPPSGDEDLEDAEKQPGQPARPRLQRSVRQALNQFEAAFVEAANSVEKTPEQPALVFAYSALCMRLVLRYRLRDDRLAPFWTSVMALVRALLCPLDRRAPLISVLRSDTSALSDEAAELLALLISLLAWRQSGGRLEGESAEHGIDVVPSPAILREALAALDRAAAHAVSPASLPATLNDLFPDPPERLQEFLSEMRLNESPSDRTMRLRHRVEAVLRGEVQPERDDPDYVRQATRRAPLYVVPWTESCPRCHQVLAGVFRGRLLTRQAVQCGNTTCSRWLLPSEGA